jgi:arsenate reductase
VAPEIAPAVIDTMKERHWDAVRAIYQAGIDSGHATFASSPPASWEAWQRAHMNQFSVVAVNGDTVLGWATLAQVSGRCVYSGVAEVSVYVDPAASGRGIGTQLLAALIERSESGGLWTLQAGIFPENKASIALHEGLAFEVVGTRRRLGRMTFGPLKNQWRDVLLLERRSARVGLDEVATIAVTIFHNPDCGTSRNTLALIRNAGVEPTVIEYLKTPPDRATLRRLLERMQLTPRELLREKGTPYAELHLGDDRWTDDELIDQMLKTPILINRPIVITPWGAKLCRPSETVLDILPLAQRDSFAKEDGELVIRRK